MDLGTGIGVAGLAISTAAGYTYTIVPRGAFGGLGMGIIYGF